MQKTLQSIGFLLGIAGAAGLVHHFVHGSLRLGIAGAAGLVHHFVHGSLRRWAVSGMPDGPSTW